MYSTVRCLLLEHRFSEKGFFLNCLNTFSIISLNATSVCFLLKQPGGFLRIADSGCYQTPEAFELVLENCQQFRALKSDKQIHIDLHRD